MGAGRRETNVPVDQGRDARCPSHPVRVRVGDRREGGQKCKWVIYRLLLAIGESGDVAKLAEGQRKQDPVVTSSLVLGFDRWL